MEIIKKGGIYMTSTYIKKYLDPLKELRRINRVFNRRTSECRCEYPAVNVWGNGDTTLVTAEVPGVNREDFDISVSGDTVTLNGKRPKEELHDGDTFHRHELSDKEFSKSIRLPFNIDADKVRASYKKGVLRVSLSRLESEKPRNIKINS
jgi:HSP20 family protein